MLTLLSAFLPGFIKRRSPTTSPSADFEFEAIAVKREVAPLPMRPLDAWNSGASTTLKYADAHVLPGNIERADSGYSRMDPSNRFVQSRASVVTPNHPIKRSSRTRPTSRTTTVNYCKGEASSSVVTSGVDLQTAQAVLNSRASSTISVETMGYSVDRKARQFTSDDSAVNLSQKVASVVDSFARATVSLSAQVAKSPIATSNLEFKSLDPFADAFAIDHAILKSSDDMPIPLVAEISLSNSVTFPSANTLPNEGPFCDIYAPKGTILEEITRQSSFSPCSPPKTTRLVYEFKNVKSANLMEWALIDDDYCVPEHVPFPKWVRSQHIVEWRRYRAPEQKILRLDNHEFLVVKFSTPRGARFVRLERRGRNPLTGEPTDHVTIVDGWPDSYLVSLRESQEFRLQHHQPDLLDLFVVAQLIHRTPPNKYAKRSSHWFAVLFSHVLNGKLKDVESMNRVYQTYGPSGWKKGWVRKSSSMDRHDVVADVHYFRDRLAATRQNL
ncbi:hypothetical protein C0991_003170, partial [Blastosporella zonata]